MQEALFVPAATMANLMAVMCHCQRRGAQLLLGRDAHLQLFDHGGAAQVAGVHSQSLPDLPDGTFDLDQLELTVCQAHGSRHHPLPDLLCLENTHSSAGGRVLPFPYLQQVGAHSPWLAAAPPGPLDPAVWHHMDIVMVSTRGGWPSPTELCERLQAVSEEEMAETSQAVSILMFPWSEHTVRAVWHRDVSVHDTKLAKNKLEFVARKCQLALGLHPTPLNTGEA